MRFQLCFHPKASKELETLDKGTAQRILSALEALSENPFGHGSIKLKGVNAYRSRVGDYRIIYEVNTQDSYLTVLRVAHRKDAYR